MDCFNFVDTEPQRGGITRRRRGFTRGFMRIVLAFWPLGCGAGSTGGLAERQCEYSCDHQMQFCLGMEAADCYALCEFAVELYTQRPSCLQLAQRVWQCDQTIDWRCSPDDLTVGEPTDSSACGPERQALEELHCNRTP